MPTDAEKTRDWTTTATYIVIAAVIGYLVYTIVGAISNITKQVGNAASSVATTASSVVQSGASAIDDFFSMLGFNQFDPTTIPGYATGNWQKLMAQPNNPFTAAYQPSSNSVINPGPTVVTNSYATPIYNSLYHWYTPVDVNTLLGTFNAIPSRDLFNLTWSYLNNGVTGTNFDMVNDPNYGISTLSQAFQDALATIILNKPISA
jgi:hypothetical protein